MAQNTKIINNRVTNTIEMFKAMKPETVTMYKWIIIVLIGVNLIGVWWYLHFKKLAIVLFVVLIAFLVVFLLLERRQRQDEEEVKPEKKKPRPKKEKKVKEEPSNPFEFSLPSADEYNDRLSTAFGSGF